MFGKRPCRKEAGLPWVTSSSVYRPRTWNANGVNEHKLYVPVNGQDVAVITDSRPNGSTPYSTDTRYLHHDHLGSITAIVDSTGIEALSYDVFGKRRDASDWVGDLPAGNP